MMKVRTILIGYLIVSLSFLSGHPVGAQEAPSEAPESSSESSSDSTPSLELPALEAAFSSQGQSQSESDSIEQSPAETETESAPPASEESLPPENPESDGPPPEEQSMMSSQSITTSSGNSDGTPNTIKQLLPDVDKTTGALVYNFPVKTPPGRNGIEPGLSLVYNSFSTNADSLFGYGWDSNIQYIRRLNKKGVTSLYDDGYFESSMSGELVASSSVYSARVESGDFLKYAFASSTWTVTDKLGKIYSFGNSTSTRQYDSDSGKIYAWMLSEVRDLNGNYMTYEYYQEQGQIYPSKIYYTQYGTSTTPFEVDFNREGRSDIIPKFNTAFSVKTAYRIKEIIAKFNSSDVRKYALNYASSTTNVRISLDNVVETGYGSSTVALPAHDFTYQGSWGAFTTDTNPVCPGVDTAQGTIIADVNGDALPDFVTSNNTASSTYMNNGDLTWTLNSTFTSPLLFSNGSTTDLGVRMADINGDGRVDMVKSISGSSTVYLNTTTGWSLNTSTSTWQISEDFTDQYAADLNVRLIDVNGDGLPDIIRRYTDGTPHTAVYINNGSGWSSQSGWSFPVDNLKEGVIFVDINNDGLMDILQSYKRDSSTWTRGVYFNKGDRSWGTVSGLDGFTPTIEFNHIGNDWGVREADVNGDGYSDLVQAMNNVGQAVYLNTGTGWASSSQWAPSWNFVDSGSVDTGVRMADYNGDGMVDALDCNGGGADYFWANPGVKADLLKNIKTPLGGVTSIAYKATPKFKNGSTLLNPDLPFLLDAVETVAHGGDGISPTSTKTLSYMGGKQYWADAFDRKMAGFSKVISTDSASNTATFYFHQGDTSSSTIGEYNDHFSKIGKVYRIERADSSGNIFDKVINKWDYSTSTSASSSFVSLLQSVSLTYDGDSDHKDKAESYAYNTTSTGNIVQKKEWGEVTGSDDGTFSDTGSDIRITDVTYASNTANYVFALPATETVTNASSTKFKEAKYYYDGGTLGTVSGGGNLTKQESWKSSSSYASSTRSYNGYGLVTQQRDPRDKATNFTYDAWNLYIATSTNPLSQSTSFVYDYPSGQVALRRDANGLLFQSVYDGVSRLTEEKQPDLNATSTLVTKTTAAYTDSYNSSSILRTNYLDGSTTTVAYTYFDGFGRPIQTRTEAESDYVVADTAYNNRERVQQESLPYFSSGTSRTTATATSSLLIQYTYDPILRVASTTNAIGSTSRYYDDWKTTLTDLRGKVKHLYNDAYGNLNRVDETNGGSTYTTSYEYDLNNNLTKITDALSNVRNFTYDGLNRRLTAEDLHVSGDSYYGTWNYTHDDSGNTTQTVDPSSRTVNYTYDDLSRVITEDYTGASSTEQGYSYDFCLLGIGKLCEASSTNNVITQYQYNGVGGIARETKTVSSTAYQTDYRYDRQGNAIGITNPDSSIVTNVYNTAGLLEIVQNKELGVATTTIINAMDYAPTGKPTTISYGNGLTTTNTYDASNLYRLTRKNTTYTSAAPAGPTELYATSLYNDANLVAYYRFEGNSNDSKGSNNGTDTSISYASSTGKFSQGASFGGASYISLASLPVNSSNVTISIAFWAKTSSSTRQRFMDMGSCDITKDCIQPEIYNSGTVLGDFVAYSGVSGAVGVTDNTWHHFAYTVDGGATYKLYIDGSLVDTKSTTGLKITNAGTNTKRIGRSYLDNHGFGGAMDDVAFFNRVLTEDEILGLYNGF